MADEKAALLHDGGDAMSLDIPDGEKTALDSKDQASPLTKQKKKKAPWTTALPSERDSSLLLPQAIAHRGHKAKWPENTMAAFKSALEVGAHAIETDVHLSRDGVAVLSHVRCSALMSSLWPVFLLTPAVRTRLYFAALASTRSWPTATGTTCRP